MSVIYPLRDIDKFRMMKKILKDLFLFLFLFFISGAAVFVIVKLVIPDSPEGKKESELSLKAEKALGKLIRQQLLIDSGIADLPVTEEALIRMKDFLLQGRLSFPYDIKIILVDSNEVNAFALPGGTIIIYSGIIKAAENPREVMAVLAHEMGHLYYRDSYNAVIRSMGRKVILTLLTGGNSDLVTAIVNQLLTMSYSRKVEARADDFALKLLSLHGINPVCMALFLEKLESILDTANENLSVTQYFDTHPSVEKRIEKAKEAGRLFNGPERKIEFDWEKIKKEQTSFF